MDDPTVDPDATATEVEATAPTPTTTIGRRTRDRRPYGRVALAIVLVAVTFYGAVLAEANRRQNNRVSLLETTFGNASSYDVATMLDPDNANGLRQFLAIVPGVDSIEYVDGMDDIVVRYQTGFLWMDRCVLVEFDHLGTTFLERSGTTCARYRG